MRLNCKISANTIWRRVQPADLVLFDIKDFDVILGIYWLAVYHASIDCFHKTVNFMQLDQPSFQIQGV